MCKQCPICQSKNVYAYAGKNYDLEQTDQFAFASRKIPENMHYSLYECKDCHVLYAVDTIDQEKLAELYQTADFDSGVEAELASRTYFLFWKKYAGSKHKSAAMDIGTGEGSYLSYLVKDGFHTVVGIEPSVAPILQAPLEIRELIDNDIFRAEKYRGRKFDVISLFQTIEHIQNPRDLLCDMRSLLSEDGTVYIVCHNYRSLVNLLMGMKSPIFDIEHLQIFSPKSIRTLLENCGYSNIRIFTIRNRYPLSYWLKLSPLPLTFKKKILGKPSWLDLVFLTINVGNIGVLASR